MSERSGQIVPGRSAVAITPGDSGSGAANGEVYPACRALYVGSTGDIKVDMAETGTAVIFVGVPAGTLLPISVTRIYDADTTASSILAIS
jgi:hypothetical protein